MAMTADEYRAHAEEYIDAAGLQNAIGELAEVCSLKAEHIRANWQDEHTARAWENAARYLMRAEFTAAVRNVTPDAA